MSDLTQPDRPAGQAAQRQLEALVAAEVAGIPGVVRIEPTLKHVLRRLGQGGSAATAPEAGSPNGVSPQGVRITSGPAGIRVAVDVTISAERSALLVAQGIRERVAALVRDAGHVSERVQVTVLGIEPSARPEASEPTTASTLTTAATGTNARTATARG